MSVTTKIIGLASTVAVFAGMAFGQQALTCNSSFTPGGGGNTISPPVPIELRSEGATELVADVLANCAAAPAGSTTGLVTASLSATGLQAITSAVLNRAGVTEATLTIVGGETTTYYQGTVSGTTITFAGVTFPMVPFTLQVSNVRVNVTGQYPNNLQPVTEAVQLIAQGNGLAAVTNIPAVTVGNQRNSLSVLGSSNTPYIAPGTATVAGSASSPNNYLVCNNGGATAFTLTISELFPGAFKTQSQNTPGMTTPATAFTVAGIPGSESGSLLYSGQPGVLSGTGAANSGTRIKVVFSGIPTNATVIVPTTIHSGNGAGFTLALTSGGETGAFQQATTPQGTAAGFAPITNNVAIYEVTAADVTATGSFVFQPEVTFATNSVTIPAGPITVAVSYAPSPASNGAALASPITNIPYFANTSTTLTGSTFGACQTTLMFPFVTNQQGFDTGIVVANTGMDYLNPTGKHSTSMASGQAGACTFQFYGSVTGSTANPGSTPITSPNFPASTATPSTIATGTTYAALLSGMSPGFQGYAIAVCPFLYAKGFAFIEYGLLTNQGVVEGYLADIISSDRTASSANEVQVGNTSPESSGQ